MNSDPRAKPSGDREVHRFSPSVATHEELLARVIVASVAGLSMHAERADAGTAPALRRVFLDNL